LVKNIDLMSDWCTRDWTFDENNVTTLWEEMSKEDKRIFKFDSKNIAFVPYFRSCILGIRVNVLKDPVDTLPEGREKVKMLLVTHYAFLFILSFDILILFKAILL